MVFADFTGGERHVGKSISLGGHLSFVADGYLCTVTWEFVCDLFSMLSTLKTSRY